MSAAAPTASTIKTVRDFIQAMLEICNIDGSFSPEMLPADIPVPSSLEEKSFIFSLVGHRPESKVIIFENKLAPILMLLLLKKKSFYYHYNGEIGSLLLYGQNGLNEVIRKHNAGDPIVSDTLAELTTKMEDIKLGLSRAQHFASAYSAIVPGLYLFPNLKTVGRGRASIVMFEFNLNIKCALAYQEKEIAGRLMPYAEHIEAFLGGDNKDLWRYNVAVNILHNNVCRVPKYIQYLTKCSLDLDALNEHLDQYETLFRTLFGAPEEMLATAPSSLSDKDPQEFINALRRLLYPTIDVTDDYVDSPGDTDNVGWAIINALGRLKLLGSRSGTRVLAFLYPQVLEMCLEGRASSVLEGVRSMKAGTSSVISLEAAAPRGEDPENLYRTAISGMDGTASAAAPAAMKPTGPF